MNNHYPIKQGIITGLLVSVLSPLLFTLAMGFNSKQGWHMAPMNVRGITGLVTLIILAVGIYMAMQNIKIQNGGVLTYKTAVVAGIIVALITAIITAIGTVIYCNYLNPGYAAYMLAESKKVMLAHGETPAQINTDAPALQKQLTTPVLVMQALVGQFVMGTVISLIMGILVKANKTIKN